MAGAVVAVVPLNLTVGLGFINMGRMYAMHKLDSGIKVLVCRCGTCRITHHTATTAEDLLGRVLGRRDSPTIDRLSRRVAVHRMVWSPASVHTLQGDGAVKHRPSLVTATPRSIL